MKRWLVTITAEIPYPWKQSYSIERSGAGTAVSDAIKLYRKDIKEQKGKSKKIDRFSITVESTHDISRDIPEEEEKL